MGGYQATGGTHLISLEYFSKIPKIEVGKNKQKKKSNKKSRFPAKQI